MLGNKRRRMLLTSLGGLCMLVAGTPALAGHFYAVLNGNKEFVGGDPDGWARVKVSINDTFDRLCADVETRSIGTVTGINIYRGMPGDKSEPVVSIKAPKGDNDSDDCDKIGKALADEIQANPASFSISILTAEFPNGALAGKLVPGDYKG